MRSSSVDRPALAAVVLAAFTLAGPGCGRTKLPGGTSGAPGQYADHFDVNVSKPAGGTITSLLPNGQPDGKINCGTAGAACGPASYGWAETVTLAATPDPAYKFVTWAADCIGKGACTLDTAQYGADKWVAAAFEPESWYPGRLFLVAVQRPAHGTISSSDGKILCGSAAARCGPVPYAWSATTTVTATPDAGFVFQGWTESCAANGLDTTCELTSAAPADKTVGANFGTMDANGGVVENPAVPGVVVTVPPGAVDTTTPITVSVAAAPEPPPAGVEVLSPVYEFGPAGTVFADVVDVEVPVPPGQEGKKLGLYWSKHLAPGYDFVGGVMKDGKIKAKVLHLSDGFVAEEPATRTIQGTRFLTYLGSGSKLQNVPDSDNLLDEVAAYVPNPSGGYTYYPGSAGVVNGSADGTFWIEGVPPGKAIVQVGVRFVETAENSVSLTRLLYGRPDMLPIPYLYPPGPPPTFVQYDVTNLEPWQPGDELHLFSPDADTLSVDLFPAGVVAGSTEVIGARDLTQTSRYIPLHEIDGTGHGDTTFLGQLSGRTSESGVRYLAQSRMLKRTTFDLAPVTNPSLLSQLVGPLGTRTIDRSLSLDWNAGAFDDALAPLVPSVPYPSNPTASFLVLGEPNALQYGITARVDKRTFVKVPVPAGTRNVFTGAMPFAGTPREDIWGLYWNASLSRCCIQLQPPPPPGQPLVTFGYAANIQHLGAMTPLGTPTVVSLLAPEITPVTNITINGDPLDTPRTGVGLVPTIAWAAPATGADVYTVLIQHLVRNPDGTVSRAAVIDTTSTSLELPPGVLAIGEPYAVTVRAARRGVDVTRPVRTDLPLAQASTTSQWFTP